MGRTAGSRSCSSALCCRPAWSWSTAPAMAGSTWTPRNRSRPTPGRSPGSGSWRSARTTLPGCSGRPPMTSLPGKDLAKSTPVTGDAPRRVTGSDPEVPVVPVKGPAQVISLVPWLLGFQPGNADLVVIGTAPPRGRVTLTWRWDLPDPATPVLAIEARHAVAALAVQGCTKAVAVGFGPDRLV